VKKHTKSQNDKCKITTERITDTEPQSKVDSDWSSITDVRDAEADTHAVAAGSQTVFSDSITDTNVKTTHKSADVGLTTQKHKK